MVLAAVAALSPDIDPWLVALVPGEVHHHGVTHTVLFVTILSAIAALVVTTIAGDHINEWLDPDTLDRRGMVSVTFLALLAGGLSHLFADMLSAPDISTPIEPLWPLSEWTLGLDLVWYNAWWINAGFLGVMLCVHLAAAYATTPSGERHRLHPF